MRDELLGYLLGAMDSDEHDRMEKCLEENPQFQRDLEILRSSVAPLADDDGHLPPPAGLAQRTCRVIAARRGMSQSPEVGASFSGGLSFRDYLIAASIVLVASTILLPAIAQSRWQSQLIWCQDRLHQLGVALSSYSEQDRERMLPYVPNHGPMARTGIFASILSDYGYVDDPSMFYCPGATRPNRPLRIPTLEEWRRATEKQREFAQLLSMLGDYAYVWGYVDETGRYHGAQNHSRSHFPLLADCPPAGVSFASDVSSPNHGRYGFNLLFEDGHVRWFNGSAANSFQDHPFLNRKRRVAPGIGRDDAVLAAGNTSPEF